MNHVTMVVRHVKIIQEYVQNVITKISVYLIVLTKHKLIHFLLKQILEIIV